MRLTQQGANRLTDEACQFNGKDFYLIPSLLETHDFDPGEFTGAVVLTYDEVVKVAKAISPEKSFDDVREILARRIAGRWAEKE